MIGNVIQTEFLRNRDSSRGAALAFVLMGVMVIGAVIYARLLAHGEITEDERRRHRCPRCASPRRSPARRGKRWTRFILPTYVTAFILYLSFPIFIIIPFSFNQTRGGFGTSPRVKTTWLGFTTEWYGRLFDLPDLTASLEHSLVIGLLSALAATALGTLLGLALARHRFRGRGSADFVIFLSISAPEIVLGAALASFFVALGVSRGFETLFLSHTLFSIAFVTVTVRARAAGLDRLARGPPRWTGATRQPRSSR